MSEESAHDGRVARLDSGEERSLDGGSEVDGEKDADVALKIGLAGGEELVHGAMPASVDGCDQEIHRVWLDTGQFGDPSTGPEMSGVNLGKKNQKPFVSCRIIIVVTLLSLVDEELVNDVVQETRNFSIVCLPPDMRSKRQVFSEERAFAWILRIHLEPFEGRARINAADLEVKSTWSC